METLQSALHIPNCCQPRRTAASSGPHIDPLRLPRDDQGSVEDISCSRERSSQSSTHNIEKDNDGPVTNHSKGLMGEPPLFCNALLERAEEESMVENSALPATGVESFATDESQNSLRKRTRSYSNDSVRTSEVPIPSTPDNSIALISRNAGAWLSPGSVVWAKTLDHEWWPAEIVDDKLNQDCIDSQHSSYILVQLFGTNKRARFDPLEDLSQFDHCYEERSGNHLTAFQDALQQALRKHVHTNHPGGRLGDLKFPIRQGPSGREDDLLEEGRGRRKRKQKIRFDEMTFHKTPMRSSRRLRIMRTLGLAAPAGSPY